VRSIGDTLQEIFARADADETTPLTAAMSLARSRLAAVDGHQLLPW
jgi:hypothetical protein